MFAISSSAEILVRAGRAARSLRDRVLVVKLGGSAMEEPAATRGTLESVVTLQTLGVRLVLVHGGGKPIDRAMAAAGLTPIKVQGRRYTDEATLAVVVRVLGELNAGIVHKIIELGGTAKSLHTKPAQPLFGVRLLLPGLDLQPVDLGRVGKPTRVDRALVEAALDAGHVPVIPSLAMSDEDDDWLNVNADTAASAVAGALNADAVLFLTDTPGILKDVRDPQSLFPRLTRSECERLIGDGIISGGMIPKVEACFEAIDAGAGRAVILDGRNPFSLLDQFLGEPAGTEIVP